jgi:hypothetical protein
MSELQVLEQPQKHEDNAAMPMRLVEMAVAKGADIDQLSKLMDMQERWEAREARKAYLDAFARFQSIVPTITKNKKGHNYMYAPLADIAAQIRESLRSCGLSYRFEIKDEGIQITVRCIVSHRDGHTEVTSMTSEPDTSGSKNAIQSRGSTVTYLQRYCLIGALGLTTADSDMDGRIAQETISEDQAAAIKKRLQDTGSDVKKFCEAQGISDVDSMSASKFGAADRLLSAKEAKVAREADCGTK